MFWNLVRYEFKNVNKWYLALYAAVLFLSVLIGIQTQSLIKLPEKNLSVLLVFSIYCLWWFDGYTCDFNYLLDY